MRDGLRSGAVAVAQPMWMPQPCIDRMPDRPRRLAHAHAQVLGLAAAVQRAVQVPSTALARLHGAADAVVLAPSREGRPNVMFSGTPVVAFGVHGVRKDVCKDAWQLTVRRLVTERTAPAWTRMAGELLAMCPARAAERSFSTWLGWKRTIQRCPRLVRSLVIRVCDA